MQQGAESRLRAEADCVIHTQPVELAFARERLGRVIAAWREQCAGAPMPCPELARFDFFTFAIGHLHLVEACPDGRFFFRIFSSMGRQYLDYHRRDTSAIRPASFRALIEGGLSEVVATGMPALHDITIEIPAPRRACSYQRLLLPYGPPGGRASLVLVGIDDADEAATAEVFRDAMFLPATARAAAAV